MKILLKVNKEYEFVLYRKYTKRKPKFIIRYFANEIENLHLMIPYDKYNIYKNRYRNIERRLNLEIHKV